MYSTKQKLALHWQAASFHLVEYTVISIYTYLGNFGDAEILHKISALKSCPRKSKLIIEYQSWKQCDEYHKMRFTFGFCYPKSGTWMWCGLRMLWRRKREGREKWGRTLFVIGMSMRNNIHEFLYNRLDTKCMWWTFISSQVPSIAAHKVENGIHFPASCVAAHCIQWTEMMDLYLILLIAKLIICQKREVMLVNIIYVGGNAGHWPNNLCYFLDICIYSLFCACSLTHVYSY